jgi:NAD(P)H-hydrate epimerase
MFLVSAEEMRELDRRTIEEIGIPGLLLMENAGRRVAEEAARILESRGGRVAVILAGKGNNGGDGLVAARHLFNRGYEVRVCLPVDPGQITGDAGVNLEIWRRMGQGIYRVDGPNGAQRLRVALLGADVVVDAIYGTGFRGRPPAEVGRIIEVVNRSGKPVVAVDVPSGVEATSGRVAGPAVRARCTVTFGLPKLGLYLLPGARYAGEVRVADISIPRGVVEEAGIKRRLLTGELVASWFAPRDVEAHKGQFGRVLVVGGSRGMIGAACLAAHAALRAGAGLVYLAVPEGMQPVAAAKLDEVITLPLPETAGGALSRRALTVLEGHLGRADVVALGPGLGTHEETVALVRDLVREVACPLVVDADGLNALAGAVEVLSARQAPTVVTPHPGEMARLLGCGTAEVQADRLAVAEKAATSWNAVVLLKGARTVVAGPDGRTYVNPTGNPGMATAGSGDVLTGIIAAFMAQGLPPLEAAAAGAFVHGRAGDLAAAEKGQPSLVAGDITAALPRALLEVVPNTVE